MPVKLYIFGDSVYAELAAHYFLLSQEYDVLGYVVDDQCFCKPSLGNLNVFKYSEVVKHSVEASVKIFSAVGYKSMRSRKSVYDRLKRDGFSFASYIAPSAYTDPQSEVSENCIVMPNVTLERNVKLEPNVTVWSGASICHDVTIGAHSFVAANSVVGGNSVVGPLCFLGFSSIVFHHCNLADETLLGAGSLLMTDSDACCQYIGSPARKVRSHSEAGIKIS